MNDVGEAFVFLIRTHDARSAETNNPFTVTLWRQLLGEFVAAIGC
jgi:hypothetical protein